ncbi:hypothetical protein, variant [Verruconis gallopava]|uniref:Uncharacterized protein n=1 Tax=Verruconis gallopava TaxID=253628 RepID=A0A0D1YKJ3_9PEZI|nr:hypothetical protein, variant [Verruconis gallopava]KIW01387.1 hypothetical protein, variant [Verruconis gallopava]
MTIAMMLADFLTMSGLVSLGLAMRNNSCVPSASVATTAPFSCHSCADFYGSCGIDCAQPNLTWANIFNCEGYCKGKLCNGPFGQPCRNLCQYSICDGLPLTTMAAKPLPQ